MKCVVRGLSSESLRVNKSGAGLEMVKSAFPCCEGAGQEWIGDAVHRCDLTARWMRVERHWELCPPALQPHFAQHFAKAAMVKGASYPEAPEGFGWFVALAQMWLLGRRVFYCNLRQQKTRFPSAQIDMLIVDGLCQLSDPACADYFEMLVGVAYHGRLDVKVALTENKPMLVQPTGFSTKGSLSRKAAYLRQQSPLQFVQRDCRERLRDLGLTIVS